jgi:hypothetical protein
MELLMPGNVSTLVPGDVLVLPYAPMQELKYITVLQQLHWPYFKLSLPFFGPYAGEDLAGPYEWRNDSRGTGFYTIRNELHVLILPRTQIKRQIGLEVVRLYNELPQPDGEVPKLEEVLHLATRSTFAAKAQALISLSVQSKGDTHIIRLRQAIETALLAPEGDRVHILMAIAVNYGMRVK